MHRHFVYTVILSLALVSGCTEILTPLGSRYDLVYFDSFESAQDTVGWSRYGAMQLFSDASPGGGHSSVRISGGCLYPHASLDIAGPAENSRLVLQCWGRNLSLGGSVVLRDTRGLMKSLFVSVSDSNWRPYQSADTLLCLKGDSLRIEMVSGGIVASAMLIDQLEIRSVK